MSQILQDVTHAAEAAVTAMQERAGGKLDYSPQSLAMVEELLAEAAPFVHELPEEALTSLVQQVGCYVLEVARKQFGGVYAWFAERQQPILVVGEPAAHIALMTWSKVRGRLKGDAGDNIPFFFQGFAERARSPAAGERVLFI